jgi:hypothetical protein
MCAMLWSLGVLRDAIAADAVRKFVKHDNSRIAATAREALAKLDALPK